MVCDAPQLPDVSEQARRWIRRIDSWDKRLETNWERIFANRVLTQVAGLDPDHVEAQRSILQYRVDFLVEPSRLVLEVDGYEKVPSPSPADADRRNARDAALEDAGYRVLHFTNAEVQSEPARCAARISSAIRAATPGENVTSSDTTPTGIRRHKVWMIGAIVLVAACVLVVWRTTSVNHGKPTSCPADAPIKGNVNAGGERIAHSPGDAFYDSTVPEACFTTLPDALDAGFRPAKR